MASKKEITKEKPRYKVQRQYEGLMKKNYNSMLMNMGKTLLTVFAKEIKDDTTTETDK